MSASLRAVAASRVFDGDAVHEDAAVLIDGDRIVAIVPRARIPATSVVRTLPDGAWLAPGFIDIQVNGGGDVLFNDTPTPAGIRAIAAAHRKFGTTSLLPTLISDRPEKMAAAVAAVASVIKTDPGVAGIHLEGPFLSPDKAGVHDRRVFRAPTAADLALLTAPHDGVTLVTLAPEQVPPGFIGKLAAAGARVSLGHSMATYAQTKAAMADGLTGFTHLFNAMRQLESREPGPVAAALESGEAWYGLIVDGLHVAPATLRLALCGAGRPILVSDAMPPVGGRSRRSRSAARPSSSATAAARGPTAHSPARVSTWRARCATACGCWMQPFPTPCGLRPPIRRSFSVSEGRSAGSRPASAQISWRSIPRPSKCSTPGSRA